MAHTIREILEKQKVELETRIAPLLKRTKEIRRELIEIEDQIRTLGKEFTAVEAALKGVDQAESKGSQLTIMQAVLEVLKGHPDGLTAQEILSEINQQYFQGSIVRASLSPQLSRLKDRDKKITLIGNKWLLSPEPERHPYLPLIERRI